MNECFVSFIDKLVFTVYVYIHVFFGEGVVGFLVLQENIRFSYTIEVLKEHVPKTGLADGIGPSSFD